MCENDKSMLHIIQPQNDSLGEWACIRRKWKDIAAPFIHARGSRGYWAGLVRFFNLIVGSKWDCKDSKQVASRRDSLSACSIAHWYIGSESYVRDVKKRPMHLWPAADYDEPTQMVLMASRLWLNTRLWGSNLATTGALWDNETKPICSLDARADETSIGLLLFETATWIVMARILYSSPWFGQMRQL